MTLSAQIALKPKSHAYTSLVSTESLRVPLQLSTCHSERKPSPIVKSSVPCTQNTQRVVITHVQPCWNPKSTRASRRPRKHSPKGYIVAYSILKKEVEAQIDDTCAESLKPVQKLCNTACQTELDNYWKAMECLREAWRKRAEEPIDFQRVLLLKAQTSPAREQFHQCSHNFFAKLRSET